MDPRDVATFFGLILLGGAIGTIVALARPATRSQLRRAAVPLGALVAAGAMAGSLYFSESAGYIPCELCWFQRIAMYPLAILLAIAAVRRDRSILPYATVLASLGLLVSAYHIQLQLWPDQSSFCDVTNPCSGRWVEAFGWMTIPQMAGLSFAMIAVITASAWIPLPHRQELA